MATLFCAVVGIAGSAFSIKIKEGKSVGSLKKKILKKIPLVSYTMSLQLFLARKNDAWLPDDDNLDAILQTTSVDSAYIHMSYVSWKLNEPSYFGSSIPDSLGERVTHVLVVVLKKDQRVVHFQEPLESSPEAIGHSARETVECKRKKQRETARQDRAKEEDKAELSHKTSKSNGAKGQDEHRRLEILGMIFDIPSVETGTAFFSNDAQEKAEHFETETDFFAFMTSEFNDLLGPGMVFVNSENYPWLSQSLGASTNIKPDGFVTHVGMYRKPKKESPKQRGTAFRFGTADKQLYDCVILFECKLKISMNAFGQVIVYLENLSPTATAFAVLFDRSPFWSIESCNGVVVKVEKSTWVTKGSKEYLQNFIVHNTSSWVERLTTACSSLGVDVVEGSAFLGRGPIGRVFKVTRSGEVLALKIVERGSVRRLYDQEEALRNAQSTGLTISPMGKTCEIRMGVATEAALLLSPVGTPFPPTKDTTAGTAPLYAVMAAPHQRFSTWKPPGIKCDSQWEEASLDWPCNREESDQCSERIRCKYPRTIFPPPPP